MHRRSSVCGTMAAGLPSAGLTAELSVGKTKRPSLLAPAGPAWPALPATLHRSGPRGLTLLKSWVGPLSKNPR